MIPIFLSIKGFYSYREPQTVDFQKLTSAHLFGIFGPVGSGKSSILEAMIFALYGQLQRIGSKHGVSANIMNLASSEMKIEFHFSSGGQIYRCIAQAKRGKRKEDVVKISREAARQVGDDWEPVDLSQIPQIIGIDYDNFTKTIIIPQGHFQDFLMLSDKERSNMMEQLFSLQKFNLHEKAAALERQNDSEIDHIQGSLDALGIVSNEDIEQLKHNIKLSSEKLQEKSQLQKETEAQLKILDEQLSLITEKQKAELLYNELQAKESEIIRKEKELEEWQNVAIQFGPLIKSKNEIEKKLLTLNNDRKKTDDNLSELKNKKEKILSELEAIKKEYDRLDELKQKENELRKLAEYKKTELELPQLTSKIKAGEKKLEQSDDEIQTKKSSIERNETEAQRLKNKINSYAYLEEVGQWYAVAEALKKEVEEAKEAFEKSCSDSEIIEEFRIKITEHLKLPKDTDLNKIGNHIEQSVSQYEAKIEKIESQLQQESFHSRLAEIAETLKEGEPCPLCGSTSHPAVYNSEEAGKKVVLLKKSKVELQEAIKKLNTLQTEYLKAKTKAEMLDKQKAIAEKTLAEKNNKVNLHRNKFVWNDFSPENSNAFTQTQLQLVGIKRELSELEKSLQQERQEIELLQNEREKIKQRLSEFQVETAKLTSKLNELKKEIGSQTFNSYIQLSCEKILEEAENTKTLVKNTAEKFNYYQKNYEQIEKDFSKNSGILQEILRSIEEEEQKKSAIENEINNKLAEANVASLSDVKSILAKEIDEKKIKAEISTFKEKWYAVKEKLSELKLKTEKFTYNEQLHTEVNANLAKLNDEIKQIYSEIEIAKKTLAESEEKAKIISELNEKLRKLQIRKANISEVKKLFHANGFVNYVSAIYLKQLIIAANERFQKMTRQQLGLELLPGNEIAIRDYMNGGKTRSIKTLSGGQTFQASLSLALALAGMIRPVMKSDKYFFFLDEGFGSLDKDSLQTVFETLRSLRKENRIVGLISHVEEMQNEIDMYISVSNVKDKGTQIINSWD